MGGCVCVFNGRVWEIQSESEYYCNSQRHTSTFLDHIISTRVNSNRVIYNMYVRMYTKKLVYRNSVSH